MSVTRQELVDTDPEEVFEWEVENLEAGLEVLGITVGTKWSKSKKANELNKALMQMKPKDIEMPKSADPNYLMIQTLQAM